MQKNNTHNTTQKNVTTSSVFGLLYNDDNYCLVPSNICYNKNEKVTVSSMEFYSRFNKQLGSIIGPDFDWRNIIIAGGFISGLLETKMCPEDYALSDVDIFIYGDRAIMHNVWQRMYDYFWKMTKGNCYIFFQRACPNFPLMNIIIPQNVIKNLPSGKNIQIVATEYSNPMDILKNFDFTHCQVGLTENGIICTDDFIASISEKKTKITSSTVHLYRILKAYHRGYAIIKPKYSYIKNVFHNYEFISVGSTSDRNPPPAPSDKEIRSVGYGQYRNRDKNWNFDELANQIEEIKNNSIVVQNMTKNYIPNLLRVDDLTPYYIEEEIHKIGNSYAGKGNYYFIAIPYHRLVDDLSMGGFSVPKDSSYVFCDIAEVLRNRSDKSYVSRSQHMSKVSDTNTRGSPHMSKVSDTNTQDSNKNIPPEIRKTILSRKSPTSMF